MSKEYETRVTSWTVAPKGEPTFSEMATVVSIDDEAAGEYVVVSQQGRGLAGATLRDARGEIVLA